jgi:GNAT superfamily N-acetyltransferase
MTHIRALSPDGWRVLREVRLASLEDSPDAFTSSYEREFAFNEMTWRDRTATCRWFVAFDEDEPIGIAGCVAGWSGDTTKRELVGMWVAPSHRQRGVARDLLDHVAEWARSDGASMLNLGVKLENAEARAAYLKMGMHPSGESMEVWDNLASSLEVLERKLG